MSVSIVVGGQLGSCGKGEAVLYWTERLNATAVVRTGGSNSGHIVYDDSGNRFTFRSLSSGSIKSKVVTIIPAGGFIDLPVLRKEINNLQLYKGKLKIDPNAVLILDKHKKAEVSDELGTGAVLVDRIENPDKVIRACHIPELQVYLCDTKAYMRKLLDAGENIIIEGTQGYGLSNIHSKYYNFVTSRDTTAAGFLAEVGLSPFDVENIIMMIHSFPVCVAENSDLVLEEIDWDTITCEMVRDAIIVNNPNIIMMNYVDYIDVSNKDNTELSKKQLDFIHSIEAKIDRKINFAGNGERVFIEL